MMDVETWILFFVFAIAVAALIIAIIAVVRTENNGNGNTGGTPTSARAAFKTNLVSDIAGIAANTDSNLVNPWGILLRNISNTGLCNNPCAPQVSCSDQAGSLPANAFFWVADNGTGLLTSYSLDGTPLTPVVTVPAPATGGISATPDGLASNDAGTGFPITSGSTTLPAQIIIVTEDGTICGYNPAVNATNAVKVIDNSVAGTAVYKGVAWFASQIYVANFRSGFVEVYASDWTLQSTFTDSALTAIGYAPFNVAAIGGQIYVTFAKQDGALHDDVAGLGNGFVVVFDAAGNFVRVLLARDQLDSPWALVPLQGDTQLLVGNFGSGQINLYNIADGSYVGPVVDCNARLPLLIDSLWGLAALPTTSTTNLPPLIFTAGINSEADGLAGSLSSC